MRTKGTHKLRALGDVQAVIDAAPDLTIAAKRLGVDRSTITRWVQTGKVQKPRKAGPAGPLVAARTIEMPAEGSNWAENVRAAYHLTETELEVLTMAEAARVAASTAEHLRDRLSAMGRFQLLVKQLDLSDLKRVQAAPAQVAVGGRQTPMLSRPRASGDPRALLMAVK